LKQGGREGKDPTLMVGIVVVGHGRLAEEMVRTLEGVLGHVEGLEAVVNEACDRRAQVRARIEDAVRRVDRGRGVLILTDMLGDTETNQSLAIARTCGAEVVTGVNMPMLIKLASARKQMDAHALAGLLRRYGQDHIVWATEAPAVVRKAQ
jgi:mannose PTS system EIIA component